MREQGRGGRGGEGRGMGGGGDWNCRYLAGIRS